MKYIFRYALLSSFPQPDHTITYEQLEQALQSVNFPLAKYDLSYLINLSISCVQKIFNKPQQKISNIIQDIFSSSETHLVPDINPKQLQTIWQQQKVNIYKIIIHNSTGSSLSYNGLKWSVRNSIMRRNNNNQSQKGSNKNNMITKFTVNCLRNQNQNQSNSNNNNKLEKIDLNVTLNKDSFASLYISLTDCQNMINQILMSE